jgi:hypothetical protein
MLLKIVLQKLFKVSSSVSKGGGPALQRVQAAAILRWTVIAGEGSFRLGLLSGLPPLSLVDMLHATGGSFDT